jgi:alkanesulfonate monooxygenase SsuD/methylene tetrahydromethanopterin reductase-like flavin-dependent oxidoreductase (luciferase family)
MSEAATDNMPAISLAAVPGRRNDTVELAADIERRGFSGIFCPSFGDAMSLCLSIAHATERLEFGTAIQPIYFQHPTDLATTAGYINEIADGRFRLGLGVTHGPVHDRMGFSVGKPLSDMRDYVSTMRGAAEQVGGLPPITLATLRDKMVGLSVEISEGAVWANASRSRMAHSLSLIPDDRKADGFYVGNMIPTTIDDDVEAAAARNRATLTGYVALPNYRNYWKEAGYEEEMTAVEVALEARDKEGVRAAMSDAWLSDCTLYGSAGAVRDGVEAWFDAGVNSPILVPSSTSGGQMRAFEELFAAYS